MIGTSSRNVAKTADRLPAVDPGQPEIEQHDVRGLRCRVRDRLLAGSGRGDQVAVRLERDAQGAEHRGLVVADEDPVRAGGLRAHVDRARIGDDVDVDPARPSQDLVDGRCAYCHAPARAAPGAEHDLRHVLGLDLAHDLGRGIIAGAPQERAPERARQRLGVRQHRPGLVVDAAVLGLDDHHEQLRVGASCEPRALADQPSARGGAAADRDQHALERLESASPRRASAAATSAISCSARARSDGEVLGGEEARQGLLDALLGVHEPSCDPLAQRARAEIDQADLVRAMQQLVRERLAHVDAGEREDAVVQALEVLEVDRRPHLDAVRAQVLDVLVALAPCAATARSCAPARPCMRSTAGARRSTRCRARSRHDLRRRTRCAGPSRSRGRAPRYASGRAARGSRSRGRHPPRPRVAHRRASGRSCRRPRRLRDRCAAARARAASCSRAESRVAADAQGILMRALDVGSGASHRPKSRPR